MVGIYSSHPPLAISHPNSSLIIHSTPHGQGTRDFRDDIMMLAVGRGLKWNILGDGHQLM